MEDAYRRTAPPPGGVDVSGLGHALQDAQSGVAYLLIAVPISRSGLVARRCIVAPGFSGHRRTRWQGCLEVHSAASPPGDVVVWSCPP
jgi:hypothetical protein